MREISTQLNFHLVNTDQQSTSKAEHPKMLIAPTSQSLSIMSGA